MDALKWRRGQRTVVSETMIVKELRSKRVAAEIPTTLLAAKATVNRSRLSNLERGYPPRRVGLETEHGWCSLAAVLATGRPPHFEASDKIGILSVLEYRLDVCPWLLHIH
jgi:hypothetical protein